MTVELVYHICSLHGRQVVRDDRQQWRHVRNNGSLGAGCTEGTRETITIVEEEVWNDAS